MSPDEPLVDAVVRLAREARTGGRPAVVGICGAQGSGKSTLSAMVADRLNEEGVATALLGLDDLYLTRGERQGLARDVHPLLATRGVPGTHDVALGSSVLDDLARPGRVRLPRFDKARDDRAPEAEHPVFDGPAEVVLFEGWCVGAVPQHADALTTPVNALERDSDRDGRWRRYVNDALASAYQALFARLDRLVLLAAPGFDVVAAWRIEQEGTLRASLVAQGRSTDGTLPDEAVRVFIQHYQRLTEHILTEMPARADAVARLDTARNAVLETAPAR